MNARRLIARMKILDGLRVSNTLFTSHILVYDSHGAHTAPARTSIAITTQLRKILLSLVDWRVRASM